MHLIILIYLSTEHNTVLIEYNLKNRVKGQKRFMVSSKSGLGNFNRENIHVFNFKYKDIKNIMGEKCQAAQHDYCSIHTCFQTWNCLIDVINNTMMNNIHSNT